MMSRTGKYIGGSTIIHTGNYGGPARDSTVGDDASTPAAMPRKGGADIDLTPQKNAAKAKLKRKRREIKSAKRCAEIKKLRVAIADLEAQIMVLEERLAVSYEQNEEVHSLVETIGEKLIKKRNRLKRYRKKLDRWVAAELQASKAQEENNRQSGFGDVQEFDAG